MRKDNLYRVEVYRFFHSMSIMKYAIIVPLALLFISYMNIAHIGELTGNLVWASLAPDFLYLTAFICAVVGLYVGREFRQKTLCYEVMRGYHFCKIAFSKTITCGFLIPVMVVICMVVYLRLFPVAVYENFWLRILYIFVFFVHLCSCTTLYVLVCRNSVMGGCLAFGRFFVLEEVLLNLVSGHGKIVVMKFMANEQWYQLVDVKTPLTKEMLICILFAAIAEYGVLQGVLRWGYGKVDM